MHIPDGYLSPIFAVGTGAVTIPVWSLAVRRVRAVLNQRTVPLLAIFAALSFTIMMFNVPVPGGTTAHGVGGALIAVVLGPWAAVICVSMALIIQALFFGDGGILAIFANCLNMAIILPFVAYGVYRLIGARAPLLGRRRIWAAGIGGYVGLTMAALAVGVELGLQPLLFSEAGRPLYSPYGLGTAVPAMLIAHALGVSVVEAVIAAFGVAFLQKRHPEYLLSLRGVVAGQEVTVGQPARRPLWQILLGLLGVTVVVFGLAGMLAGHGDINHFLGADWTQVNWADVAIMLGFVALLAVILLPLAAWLLPRRWKRIGTSFTAIAILAPVGLIAPGIAFGEGNADDVKQAFGYVPKGLQQFSGIFSAPLGGYNIPGSFFSDANAPLWHQAIGYEISGLVGILLLGLAMWVVTRLLARGLPDLQPSGGAQA